MNFKEKIYSKLRKVPYCKVTTYKALASSLNSKVYRAIGTAMNKNPCAPKVACHRVINSSGNVGGFAERVCEYKSAKRNVKGRARSGVSGTKKKIAMLKKEGVIVEKGRVDLKKFEYKL